MVPTSWHGAEYTVLPTLLLKQLKHSFNSRKQWEPPEWFRESARLDKDGWRYGWQSANEQLKSHRVPDRTGAFIGNHDVITTWCGDAFYVPFPDGVSGLETVGFPTPSGTAAGPVSTALGLLSFDPGSPVPSYFVMAAGNFTLWPSVLPVILAESGIPSLRTGSARPYLVDNRILICSGGLGLPHQQGWGSCSGVLSTLLTGTTVFATSTKC